jgi:hypothetical protein
MKAEGQKQNQIHRHEIVVVTARMNKSNACP